VISDSMSRRVDLEFMQVDGDFVFIPENRTNLLQRHISRVRPKDNDQNASNHTQDDKDQEKFPSNVPCVMLKRPVDGGPRTHFSAVGADCSQMIFIRDMVAIPRHIPFARRWVGKNSPR